MIRAKVWFVPFLSCASALFATACASATVAIPEGWSGAPAPELRSVRFGSDGSVLPSELERPRKLADGAAGVSPTAGGVAISSGGRAVTPPFADVDSLDLSSSRQEIVFSARREGDFDVGLVSTSGGEPSWLPADPADEVAVQWAPRGSKVSYVIRAPGGDVIRTLHVPTSFEYTVGFGWADIHDHAWDAAAERIAVVLSSPEESPRVEVVRYDDSERRIAVAARTRAHLSVEPFGSGVLLRPNDLRYDERLPLVVWVTDSIHAWSAKRAGLVEGARVACLVLRVASPDVLAAAARAPWVDGARLFLVDPSGRSQPGPAWTTVNTDESVPAGRYRRAGRIVSVPPAVVQSFAAAFIADQLKRTSPPNGSSR